MGNHGFLLTATDGDLIGDGVVDKVRIKIWDKASNVILYDNGLAGADGIDARLASHRRWQHRDPQIQVDVGSTRSSSVFRCIRRRHPPISRGVVWSNAPATWNRELANPAVPWSPGKSVPTTSHQLARRRAQPRSRPEVL
jgi:hypothetical protein